MADTRAWNEVPSHWQMLNIGETVEGVLQRRVLVPNRDGKPNYVYVIAKPGDGTEEVINLRGTAVLNALLQSVSDGVEVRITYTHDIYNTQSARNTKQFTVAWRPAL